MGGTGNTSMAPPGQNTGIAAGGGIAAGAPGAPGVYNPGSGLGNTIVQAPGPAVAPATGLLAPAQQPANQAPLAGTPGAPALLPSTDPTQKFQQPASSEEIAAREAQLAMVKGERSPADWVREQYLAAGIPEWAIPGGAPQDYMNWAPSYPITDRGAK